MKEPLPPERSSTTRRVVIGDQVIYLTWGCYEDGRLGEIALKIQKEGSTLDGWARCFGIACSIALQNGVPLGYLSEKFCYQDFPPQGLTDDRDIPTVDSIPDFVFKKLGKIFYDDGTPRPKPTRKAGIEMKG